MNDNAKNTPPKVDRNKIVDCADHGEAGAGTLFALLFRDQFLAEKVASRGGSKNVWYHYNGQYWELDKLDNVVRAIRSMQDVFLDEAKRIEHESDRDDKNAKALIQRLETAAYKLDRHSFCMNASLVAAEGKGTLAFDGDKFDKQPFKIPCENGILDPLKCSIGEDGKIHLDTPKAWRPMRPDDYVRLVCAPFNIEAECPEWEKFLTDALDGDTPEGRAVIEFIQVFYGYILLGDPRQDLMSIKYSPNGRSGKGLMDKAMLRAFGTLGVTTKSGLFLKKQGNDPNKPEPAVMALKNKRLVVMSEQGKGEVYDSAEVKTKTSGRDEVPARGLYGEETTFLPTYVFTQSTNDLPRVGADDGAFWARVILIPFPFHYVDDPDPSDPTQKLKDAGLEARLEAETSGILNWCIVGAIKYIQAGYKLPKYPKRIQDAIAEYRRHEDSLADFISDCCTVKASAEVKAADLFERYKVWCGEAGRHASSRKTFLDGLKRKRYESKHTRNGSVIYGIGLITD